MKYRVPVGELRYGKACGNGFTLVELVVTVAIVAVLALGLVPLSQMAATRAKETELRSALRDIRTAIDAYKKAADLKTVSTSVDQSGYPPTLEILVEGVRDRTAADGRMIYFMRRIPRDPFFNDAEVSAAKTWGLRSYKSPPDDPQEGDDVFDVFSNSDKTGMNGVPYREW